MSEVRVALTAEQQSAIREMPASMRYAILAAEEQTTSPWADLCLFECDDHHAGCSKAKAKGRPCPHRVRVARVHPENPNWALLDFVGPTALDMTRLKNTKDYFMPTVAIKQVVVRSECKCILSQTQLSDALCRIPLKAREEDFCYPREDNFTNTMRSTILFDIDVSHPGLPDSPERFLVTSADLVAQPPHDTRLVGPVSRNIPICWIVKGQRVYATALASKDIAFGKDRIDHAPSALLGFRQAPVVRFVPDDSKMDEKGDDREPRRSIEELMTKTLDKRTANDLKNCCPMRVFDIEDCVDRDKAVARIARPLDCNHCGECRIAGRSYSGLVQTARDSKRFLWPIRSHVLSPQDLIRKTIAICMEEDTAARPEDETKASAKDETKAMSVPSDEDMFRAAEKLVKTREARLKTSVPLSAPLTPVVPSVDERRSNPAYVAHRLRITIEKVSGKWYEGKRQQVAAKIMAKDKTSEVPTAIVKAYVAAIMADMKTVHHVPQGMLPAIEQGLVARYGAVLVESMRGRKDLKKRADIAYHCVMELASRFRPQATSSPIDTGSTLMDRPS